MRGNVKRFMAICDGRVMGVCHGQFEHHAAVAFTNTISLFANVPSSKQLLDSDPNQLAADCNNSSTCQVQIAAFGRHIRHVFVSECTHP